MQKILYPHADPILVGIIDGPRVMRESYIFRDRFILYPGAEYVLRRLEHLYRFPQRIRMPCLVIGGDSGMGKTTLLKRFQATHPDITSAKTIIKPIVYAQMPSDPDIGKLGEELLMALGGPAMDVHPKRMRRVIRELLKDLKTAMVMFDEVQHAARLSKSSRLPLIDWFKELSTNAQIPVVCAGVRGVEQLFKDDRQLSSRFAYVELPEWAGDAKLAAFLRTYERTLPLKRASHLASREMMKAILKKAGANTDQIIQCLSMAAIVAIRSGEERITTDLLDAWNDPPLLEEDVGSVQPPGPATGEDGSNPAAKPKVAETTNDAEAEAEAKEECV